MTRCKISWKFPFTVVKICWQNFCNIFFSLSYTCYGKVRYNKSMRNLFQFRRYRQKISAVYYMLFGEIEQNSIFWSMFSHLIDRNLEIYTYQSTKLLTTNDLLKNGCPEIFYLAKKYGQSCPKSLIYSQKSNFQQ